MHRTRITYDSFKGGLESLTTQEKVRANIYARARHLNGLFFLLQNIDLNDCRDGLADITCSLRNAAELGGLINDTGLHDLEELENDSEEEVKHAAANS